MRVEFSKGKFLDENGTALSNNAETPSGTLIQFKVVKNKTCPPDRRVGFYTINWNGVDYLADLIEVAILYGVIVEQSKGYFVIPDISEDKIHGKGNVRVFLEEHQDILKQVDELVAEKIK